MAGHGEDLIRTDRQDILWSHQLGQAFESWGQALVKRIGTLTREPKKKKAWQRFKEKSDIEAKVAKAFPSDEQKAIRESTLDIAKQLARTTSTENLEDDEHIKTLIGLSLMLGPHITLDQQLRDAADEKHVRWL